MNRFAAVVLGLVLSACAGQSNSTAVETKYDNQELANNALLTHLVNNRISQEDFLMRAQPVAEHSVVFFWVWGITIHPYSAPGIDNCAEEVDFDTFACPWSEDPRMKCMIQVDVASGPVAGHYVFARTCDGHDICHPISGGLEVDYETSTSW